jgi:hypothetical protein
MFVFSVIGNITFAVVSIDIGYMCFGGVRWYSEENDLVGSWLDLGIFSFPKTYPVIC